MYDLKYLREHAEIVKNNNRRRGFDIDIDELLQWDSKRRTLQSALEQKRAERNFASKTKPSDEEREQRKALSTQIAVDEHELTALEEKINERFSWLPNIIADDVPNGRDDSDNQVLREVGERPIFTFPVADHLEIGERLDIIDTKHAASVSGSRFYFLKNEAAMLRLALHQWGWKKLKEEGFTLLTTPHLAKTQTLYGTGYLPFFSDDIWKLNGHDLSLIGTSEQTLVSYHQNEILPESSFPVRYTATSECFRTEAGSYGKDTRGIFRVHEFWKMEQIVLATPQQAETEHQNALAIEEWFAQSLALPYRIVLVCTGDCGAPGYKKYDLEAWFPSQERYRELTSNTNITDFQTRRLNIRYQDSDGQTQYPYSISATAITDRFLIAILENYQQADGSVRIPDVLQPYMGIDAIRPKS